MQMGLLTFSDMDCFVIFYPLYLSVHGTLIQQISMVNNPPCRKPVSDHASAGVRFQAPRLRNVNCADSLLAQNHVSVRLGNEFSRDDSPYRIILCKVRKKNTAEFEKSMESLRNKMLLFGHNDYMEFCNGIMETLEQNRGAA